MLNKTLTRISLAIPALLAVSTVSAHPGDHAGVTMSQLVDHMLASPFHAGMIVATVAVVAFIIRKVSNANKPE